jgi:hypothetical protein
MSKFNGEPVMLALPRHFTPTLTLVVLLFGWTSAAAAILSVGSGCTYATPQLAFAAANNGDTLRIRSGNYAGPFVITKAIRVEGGYNDCVTTARAGRSDFYGSAPTQSSESLLRIPALSGQVVLDRITLRDNYKTSGDGGGIHLTSVSLLLNAVEILDNRALDGNGGGIYLDNANVELVEDASLLIARNRANAGGGIAANGNQARIRFDLGAVGGAATFRNNQVNANTGTALGSAIYLYNGGDATLIDTLIEVESGQPYGARSAVEIADSPSLSGLTVRNSDFLFHEATRYTAITALGSNAHIEINGSLIEGWSSGLVLRDGSALLDQVNFHANGVNGYGAGIRLLGDAVLEGHSLEFNDNSALDGGAMAVFENASWSLFGAPGLPTRFSGNLALRVGGLGGAIYHNSTGSGSINDSPAERGLVEFRDNQALPLSGPATSGEGGAIYVDADSAPQLSLNSPMIFESNISGSDGGAINVNRGQLSLDARVGEQISFVNNRSYSDGGAIRKGNSSLVLINRNAGDHGTVLFSGNVADAKGGSIASFGAGELRIQAPVQFVNASQVATADYGGQIYAFASAVEQSTVELQGWDGSGRGIVIAGGYAEFEGGGAYLNGVDATLDWVQFGLPTQPNRVFVSGGANLVATGSGTDVTLRNSSLRYGRQATSGGNGHGLLVRSGAQALMESVYGVSGTPPTPGEAWPCEAATLGHDNHCSEIADNGDTNTLAGGVYVETNAQLSLSGVSIDRNQGTPGGVMIENGGSIIAQNVRISRNSGGIALLAGAQMLAEHLTVAGNTGTAIELADASTTSMDLSRSIVWGNTGGIVKGAQASLTADCNISQTAAYGLNADPQFVDSVRGLYRIGGGSSALDHCPGSSSMIDLDGDARPQGMNYDAGAFEGLAVTNPDLIFADGFE